METIDKVDLGLTVLGLVLAIWAMVLAGGAKRAVSKVIVRNDDQTARDTARDLLAKLMEARDAAMARRQGASRMSSAGRSLPTDKKALELAQDALATATVGTNQQLERDLRQAANQIDGALKGIAASSAQDEWADALGVLQGVIPKVDALQRTLASKVLR